MPRHAHVGGGLRKTSAAPARNVVWILARWGCVLAGNEQRDALGRAGDQVQHEGDQWTQHTTQRDSVLLHWAAARRNEMHATTIGVHVDSICVVV